MAVKEFAPGGVVNIDKCLDEGTQVSVWNAQHGKATTAKLLAILITDLVNSFNVGRPMNPGQIEDLAIDMTNDLWQFRIEEIGAFFQGVKRGTYGKIYERLDAPIIWEYWGNYLADRMEVTEIRQARKMFYDTTITKIDAASKEAGRLESVGARLGELKALRDPNKKI